MPEDALFSAAEARLVRPLPTLLPACGRCGLHKSGCRTPKMAPDGEGRRRVLIVADHPDRDADREGVPFAGRVGDVLRHELRRIDVDLRRDCWSMYATSCHNAGDADPKTPVTDCRPLVLGAIKRLDPLVVILVGNWAVKSVIGHLWKEKCGLLSRWAGWQIPAHKPNVWVCPTYDPHDMLEDSCDPVTKVDFRQHLEAAFSLTQRPWDGPPPDYESRVEVIADADEAAARLRRYTAGIIAYDYETTCSKPEGPGSEIACASVCWEGKETIAFPYRGRGAVRAALRDVLQNPDVACVASNIDMESRWTRKHMGIEVANWYWDTMLAAHAIDPRGDEDRRTSDGISGLKFQAFARLGVPAYNDHIEPFLIPDERGGYALNRIREVKPYLLMKYCGLDAALEFDVMLHQRAEMGL